MSAPLLDLARALDHAVMAASHLAALAGSNFPPAEASLAEALAHYGSPTPQFHAWAGWRAIEALRPWTTQPSVGRGAAATVGAGEQPSLPESAA